METIKGDCFSLLLSPEDIEEFRSLLRDCNPLDFLDNRHLFRLIIKTENDDVNVPFGDIYKISEASGRICVHYKIKDRNTDKFVFSRIGPIDRSFLEFFLLPFFEKEVFCKKVAMIIGALCLSLKDSENEIGRHFDDLRSSDALRIACVKKENYEEAGLYRDKAGHAAGVIKNYFLERLGHDFDEIIDYVLRDYHNLMFISGLSESGEKRV